LPERRVVNGNIALKDNLVIILGGNSNCNVESFTIEDNKITNWKVGASFKQVNLKTLEMCPSFFIQKE
jgi:hypothetical protein